MSSFGTPESLFARPLDREPAVVGDGHVDVDDDGEGDGDEDDDGDDDGSVREPTLDPPMGLAARAELTRIELAWVAGAHTNVEQRGYFVYYWRADETIARARRVPDAPTAVTRYMIDGLVPGTAYHVSVRAATELPDTTAPEFDPPSGVFLSRFCTPVEVATDPDLEVRFEGGSFTRGVFTVRRWQPDDDDPNAGTWLEGSFFASLGDTVGGTIELPGHDDPVDLGTPYRLDRIDIVRLPDTAPLLQPLLRDGDRPVEDTQGNDLQIPVARPAQSSRLVAFLAGPAGDELRLVERTGSD